MKTLANLLATMALVIVALMVAPAVDAAVCGPDKAVAAHQFIDGPDGDADQIDLGGDIHGHCHHPAEREASSDFKVSKPLNKAIRYVQQEPSTVSFTADGLKRPPRI